MNNKKLCGDKKRGVLIQPERAGCSEDVEVTMSAVHKRIEGAGGQLNQDTFNPRQRNRMLLTCRSCSGAERSTLIFESRLLLLLCLLKQPVICLEL